MGELSVVGKALAGACDQTREGDPADAIDWHVPSGPAAPGASAVRAGAAGDGAREGDLGAGIVPAFVVAPGSTDEAAAVLRIAAENELAVVARGSGSRLGWGAPPSRCDLLVDLSRMSAVVEHSAGDLVARVQAGARMADVGAALAQAGQEIALDVPGRASVGGVVATGLAGPRRLRYGTPRDLLIGITIVRADGTVARSGGKVVKNVAGYDLGKLLAGSAGTLALITDATFRLHPLPAARAYVTAEYVAAGVACDAVAAAANSPLVASAVELSRPAPGGPIRVGVLIEGSAEGVAARAMRMAGLLGPAETALEPPPWWGGAPEAGGGTLARVSFWVSALPRVLDAIDAAAAEAGPSPTVDGSAGAGVLYLRFGDGPGSGSGSGAGSGAGGRASAGPAASLGAPSGMPPGASPGAAEPSPAARASAAGDVARFVRVLRAGLAGERGGVAVLAAPGPVRAALAGDGGMAGSVPGLALMRAVKDQFDPGHRLAPGRFPDVI